MEIGTAIVADENLMKNVTLFIKRFEELHEIAAQHYLRKQKGEFYVFFRKILFLQENILQKMVKSKRF